MPIVFIQCSYLERKTQTLACVRRLAPYVDRVVIVAPEPAQEWIELAPFGNNIVHVQEEWKDDLPAYNNVALSQCNIGDWVLYTDPDELVCETFAKEIKDLASRADAAGYQILCLNSHDIMYKADGTQDSSISTAYRCMFFKNLAGTQFAGIGELKVLHQTIHFPPGMRSLHLSPQYYYEHIKQEIEVWERSSRNVWIAGGGNCVGAKNPMFLPLRKITDRLGLKRWPEVREYLRRGKVDGELLDWIKQCRTRGGFDYEDENRGCWIYYAMLHADEVGDLKEEVPKLELGSPQEVMRFIEDKYLGILGRHADTPSKESYCKLILEGKLKREKFEEVLKSSTEYKMKKWGSLPEKPKLSSEDLKKAIFQSEWYWKDFKPHKDLGETVESLIPQEKREGFWQQFYTKKPRGLELIQLIEEHG